MLKSGVEINIDDKTLEECLPELSIWQDEDVAFVKKDMENGKQVWAIYSADGTRLASTDSRDFAIVMAKQNDYKVLSAH
ncbi:MAG: DUF1150 domain-containing protein [Lactobacillus sp.]|jgi:hypothetical protein|nr:DUF1150 domain-containing protein [Lactobacillus sp.]